MNNKAEPVPKSEFELKREHRELMEFIEIRDLTQRLHKRMFPEEWDFMMDSRSDAHDRRINKNPCAHQYIQSINAKRRKIGLEPLSDNGLPVSSRSWEIAHAEAEA